LGLFYGEGEMDRVEIAKAVHGICHMIVCAEDDVTDEEILTVCNRDNPSGTTGGWQDVIREVGRYHSKNQLPVKCKEYEGRTHFMVAC
jgi:hypothetical protein